MKRILILTFLAASLLSACAVTRHGVVVPYLPPVVVLEADPYYYHDGYHYHYYDNRWYYSRSRRGPWADLPRDHYPKELRYKKKKHWKKHRGHGHDHDDDRYYDDRYRRY